MRLKYAITIADPKSAQITDFQSKSTGVSHLTKVDILTALGYTQARCPAGLNLLIAKYTKDSTAAKSALSELVSYAKKNAPKMVGKISGRQSAIALNALSMLVLEEYCRTADTLGAKCRCGGSGEVYDVRETNRTGELVAKQCSRCNGRGVTPVPSSRAYRVISKLIPEVNNAAWYRYWHPFYEKLYSWCLIEESRADYQYKLVTNMSIDVEK